MSKNEGTSQEISVREVEKIESKFSKAWFFLSDGDRTGIYNSVQNAVRQVNLSDERQLRIIKIVRAIYQANVASRSIGHTVSLGLLATVIALFCSVASVVDGGAKLYFLDTVTYVMWLIVAGGFFMISFSTASLFARCIMLEKHRLIIRFCF